uniref:Uncharacterized protein n=1 Tax=Siphoviridae sp. ctg0K17 TaxID=2825600 RepID=A0A8S5PVW9_9CAUD|nr:MAG TPA: hypothetical protein [Siphoviridae sp. ctg0K17]DAJ08441.1 MAG TPA: hypothetical protein [Caudoviricetes sp.]
MRAATPISSAGRTSTTAAATGATPAGEAFRAAPESLLHWERPGRCAGNSPGCVSRRVLQCATPTAIPRAS